MQTIEADLKKKQLVSVQKYIFEQNLRETLSKLADSMPKNGLYSFTKTELADAETALEKLNG